LLDIQTSPFLFLPGLSKNKGSILEYRIIYKMRMVDWYGTMNLYQYGETPKTKRDSASEKIKS